jgi:hypothetical protein
VYFRFDLLFTRKRKEKKVASPSATARIRGRGFYNKNSRISSPSAWVGALAEEDFFLKKILPRVLHSGKRIKKNEISSLLGKRICLKNKFPPRVLHSGKMFFFKKGGWHRRRQIFPKCTIFGTRGRPLHRERHCRKFFPECCTRGRLP